MSADELRRTGHGHVWAPLVTDMNYPGDSVRLFSFRGNFFLHADEPDREQHVEIAMTRDQFAKFLEHGQKLLEATA